MEIFELSKEDIINEVTSNQKIGKGRYGLVTKYNNDSLLKLYYRDLQLYDFYNTGNYHILDSCVELAKLYSLKRKILPNASAAEYLEYLKNIPASEYPTNYDNITRLIVLGLTLENTKSDIIKGLAVYNDYVVGVVLKYYKNYVSLNDIYSSLNNIQKYVILTKIKMLLNDLIENSVYPTDICNLNNILVSKSKDDVKLVDLDDINTICGSNYNELYNDSAKTTSLNSYEFLKSHIYKM